MAVGISSSPVSLPPALPANELRSVETVLDKVEVGGEYSTTQGCCLCLFVSCLLGTESLCVVAQSGLECKIP